MTRDGVSRKMSVPSASYNVIMPITYTKATYSLRYYVSDTHFLKLHVDRSVANVSVLSIATSQVGSTECCWKRKLGTKISVFLKRTFCIRKIFFPKHCIWVNTWLNVSRRNKYYGRLKMNPYKANIAMIGRYIYSVMY